MVPVFSIIVTLMLPAVVIWKSGKKPLRKPYLFSVGSFAFCGIALLQEILTIKRRLWAGDLSGLEDTIGAVLVICVVLLIGTALLNWFALALSYGNENGTV